MKRPTSHIIVPGVILVMLLGAWCLRDRHYIYYALTEIDINSGDFRDGVYLGALPLGKRTIRQTPLSREVRRLGIAIPPTRVWKWVFIDHRIPSGVDTLCKYSRPVVAESHLRMILDETRTPDQERRIVLERFMAALRTQDSWEAAEEGRLLTDEIAERHGMEWFTPEYTSYLRQKRAPRAPNHPAGIP